MTRTLTEKSVALNKFISTCGSSDDFEFSGPLDFAFEIQTISAGDRKAEHFRNQKSRKMTLQNEEHVAEELRALAMVKTNKPQR